MIRGNLLALACLAGPGAAQAAGAAAGLYEVPLPAPVVPVASARGSASAGSRGRGAAWGDALGGLAKGSAGDDRPWGLGPELLDRLERKAEEHRQFALRFACREAVRRARYDRSGFFRGESAEEDTYLLVWDRDGTTLRELRGRGRRRGGGPPPAYSWALLFGDSERGYFSDRDLA